MLAGTDKNDPCDPNPECAACLALKPAAATPTPTAAPTAAPTAKPTGEQGFEAVFANFFASQKPLLKMLRYCWAVSSGVSGGEKEEAIKAKKQTKPKTKI